MNYTYQRRYTGPLQVAILDWAGTVMDFGCLAPVDAFTELFAREGIALTLAQVREPMGTEKREHIRRILQIPAVAAAWRERKGTTASEADIDRLYQTFQPLQLATLPRRAVMIPGALEAAAQLRARGMRIGANTGYNRQMLALCEAAGREQGYVPDVSLASEDAPRGRPYADLALLAAMRLSADCVQACVKVDDTVPGIEEGLNAGMWTVAVSCSGNELGLSLEDWRALSATEKEARRAAAAGRLARAGAHFVIDTIADLSGCIEAIEQRLRAGIGP